MSIWDNRITDIKQGSGGSGKCRRKVEQRNRLTLSGVRRIPNMAFFGGSGIAMCVILAFLKLPISANSISLMPKS